MLTGSDLARSRRFYLGMVCLGYGIGLPLMVFDAVEFIDHRFSFEYINADRLLNIHVRASFHCIDHL